MTAQRYSPSQIEVMEDLSLYTFAHGALELTGAVFAGISAINAARSVLSGKGGLPRLAISGAIATGLAISGFDNLRLADRFMIESTGALMNSMGIEVDSSLA